LHDFCREASILWAHLIICVCVLTHAHIGRRVFRSKVDDPSVVGRDHIGKPVSVGDLKRHLTHPAALPHLDYWIMTVLAPRFI